MRTLPHLTDEIVTIGCTPNTLALAWITRSGKRIPTLMAYHTLSFQHLQLHNAQLFNPTALSSHITDFLAQHKLSNAFIGIWLNGPAIKQQLITCSHAEPTAQELGIVDSHRYQWDYQYLYPTDDGRFVFYVTSIAKELIFQYQLLAITAHLHLITLTTYQIALLHLYRFIQGKTFRHSKLAYDITGKNNQLDLLFTPESITRTIAIHPTVQLDMATELPILLGMAGLFIMETTDEKN